MVLDHLAIQSLVKHQFVAGELLVPSELFRPCNMPILTTMNSGFSSLSIDFWEMKSMKHLIGATL